MFIRVSLRNGIQERVLKENEKGSVKYVKMEENPPQISFFYQNDSKILSGWRPCQYCAETAETLFSCSSKIWHLSLNILLLVSIKIPFIFLCGSLLSKAVVITSKYQAMVFSAKEGVFLLVWCYSMFQIVKGNSIFLFALFYLTLNSQCYRYLYCEKP